jgi:Carboxypeptidase regulatory-like domain
MWRYLRCLVMVAAFFGHWPAFAIGNPAADDPQKYKVEGTIINAVTGRPIPRALVQWSSTSGQKSLLSGPDGDFSFDGVPEGRAQFLVRKPGYFQGRGGAFSQRTINFPVGSDSTKLVVKLTPEAVIFGRVLGKDGEPVEGASIRVERPAGGSNLYRGLGMHQGRTDEDGSFRVPDLTPGRYVVAVQAGFVTRRILGAQSAPGNEAYPPVIYYPAAIEEANAEQINVAAGQRLELNFSITPRPAYRVSGSITRPEELKQLSPPAFVDRQEQVILSADEFDPQTGIFTFRKVPAGNYTLRLSAADDAGNMSAIHQRMSVHKELLGLRLVLSRGLEVPVHVRKELTARPASIGSNSCSYGAMDGKVHTSDCSDYPPLQLVLNPVESGRSVIRSNWVPPATEPLVLHGLQPGRYRVQAISAMVTGAGYVASLRCGGTDLLRDELVVPETGQIPAIEAVLRDDLATVNLSVRSEKNTKGMIAIVSTTDAYSEINANIRAFFTSDSTTTSQLPPGDYTIFAFDDAADIDINDAEELALYAKKAKSVTLYPGKTSNVVLDVIRTGD